MHANENDIIFIISLVQYGPPPSDEIWSSCWRQSPKPRRVQNRGILGSAPKNAAPQRALLRPRGAHFAPPPGTAHLQMRESRGVGKTAAQTSQRAAKQKCVQDSISRGRPKAAGRSFCYSGLVGECSTAHPQPCKQIVKWG